MKTRILACGIAFTLLAGGLALSARAQEQTKEKRDQVEKAGVLEVIKADAAKKEKYSTLLLKVGEETFKLLPGNDKKLFKGLETLGGKSVTVKGTLLPANPPKYPLAAIKVASFAETGEEKSAPAKPAAAKAKK